MHAADRLTLTFVDPLLERRYRAWFASRTLGYLRGGAVLLAVLFAAFAPVDLVVAPGRVAQVWAVRLGVAVPGLLAFLPLLFLERFQALRERWLQEVMALQAVVATASLVAIGAVQAPVGDRTMLEVSAMGMGVATSFLYGLSRLRFVYAVPIGVGFTGVGLAIALAHPARADWLVAAFGFYAVATNGIGGWIARVLERISRAEFSRERQLSDARARSDALLRMALPAAVADRVKASERPTFAERHADVTVVQVDLAGFTPLAARLQPAEVAALLDALFARVDELCERHGVVKIKTLGDGWLGCAGAPVPRPDHARAAVAFARELLPIAQELSGRVGAPLGLRIGVASGEVVAGIIGRTRFAYDLWGPAVRLAGQMEQGGSVGRVRLAPSTAKRLPPGSVDRDDDGALWLP